ncbi:MAG TPA: EF-hand domain-containing protein [Pirellulales bacterium]|jgi:hypothetical protein|nr:EF-hand domain-containing protein [Pirellulales bacterium]
MRVIGLFSVAVWFSAATMAAAQAERDAQRGAGGTLADRLMKFDANEDGKLTKDEVTDERLQSIFVRIDVDKDGTVTKEEIATFAKESGRLGDGGQRRGPSDGGPRGNGQRDRGGPPGGGPGAGGGPGGPGGRGGPPKPGDVLPPGVQDMLDLSDQQREQLATLQKEVNDRLKDILTKDQHAQLREMRERGPRGGAPGGPGPREGGPPPAGGPGDRPRPPRDTLPESK